MVSGRGLFDQCSNEFDCNGLIVDGLDGSADILKWGLHYQVAGKMSGLEKCCLLWEY